MKKTTKAAAVAASVLLAVSGAPAAANAQSGDSTLPAGVTPGSVLDAIGLDDLGGVVQGLLGTLTGSATGTAGSGGDIAGGSANLNPLTGSSAIDVPGSTGLLTGSSQVPGSSGLLTGSGDVGGSADLLGGSAALPGSSNLLGGSSNLPTDLTGSLGTVPLSADLLGGSSQIPGSTNLPPLSTDLLTGSGDVGSGGMAPLSTQLGTIGSAGMAPLSTDLLTGSGDVGSGGMAPLSTQLGTIGSAGMAPLVASAGMAPLSADLGFGSAGMAPLSTDLLGGSAGFDSSDLAPLTGSTEMAPLSTDMLGGSAEVAPVGSAGMAPIVSSLGMEPLSTELNLLGGSAALPALSANFPDGSTGGIGGSAADVGDGISGSLERDSLGTLVGSVESNSAQNLIDARAGSLTGVVGSLTGESGSIGGSSDVVTGSFEDLTAVNGSLTALTGSLATGSDTGTDLSVETVTSSGGAGSLLPLLAVGASAAGGVAVGAGLNADVALPGLPPLPPLPTLCDLPQAQVDQLAGAGSVDAQNCPDPQN